MYLTAFFILILVVIIIYCVTRWYPSDVTETSPSFSIVRRLQMSSVMNPDTSLPGIRFRFNRPLDPSITSVQIVLIPVISDLTRVNSNVLFWY